jgi:hypothetical protein
VRLILINHLVLLTGFTFFKIYPYGQQHLFSKVQTSPETSGGVTATIPLFSRTSMFVRGTTVSIYHYICSSSFSARLCCFRRWPNLGEGKWYCCCAPRICRWERHLCPIFLVIVVGHARKVSFVGLRWWSESIQNPGGRNDWHNEAWACPAPSPWHQVYRRISTSFLFSPLLFLSISEITKSLIAPSVL